MSYVNVMLVKDGKVCFFCCHYKTILSLLDKGFDSILELTKRKNFLDSGWLVFDFDKETAISSQTAFPLSRLSDWNVFEI